MASVTTVVPFTGMNDRSVASIIQQRIPQGTYASLAVETVNYRFVGAMGDCRTRKITLELSRVHLVWSCFEVFLKSILAPIDNQAAQPNSQAILSQLSGQSNTDEGVNEMRKAYVQCYTLTLFLSDDQNFCELKMDQSTFYIVAQKAGQICAMFVPLLASTLENAVR